MLCAAPTSVIAPREPRDAPTGPTGVCAADPFGLDGGAAEPPVGRTEEEMQRFVELISRVAYCDDPEQEVDAFVESVDIERQLGRTGAGGLTLYDWLLQKGEEVVSLRSVREEFGYDLRLSRGYQMNDDAMYKRLVDAEVEASLRRFLVELDMTAASLPGLADGEQEGHLVEAEAMRAKNQALYELQLVLSDPDATQAALLQTALGLRARMARRAVVLRIERVKAAIQGVNCLAKLCQSATNPEELRCFLQGHFSALADVCANPPDFLSSQLRMRGLSLTVLAACISRPGGSCVGASSMRPSFGRALDTIECFFASGQRRRDMAECCVSAVNLLRGDVQAGPEAARWHGVGLCGHADAMAAVAELGLQSAFRLRGPAHACASTGLYVRALDDSCCALRVARFAHLLVECVRSRVLEVGKLRASLLLPSVARWATDKRFRAAGLGYFSEIGEDSFIQRRPERPAAKEAPAPMLMPAGVEQHDAPVREDLVRDYHIVLATRRVVAARTVKIGVVKDLLTAKGGFLEKSTPASVSAAVCRVVEKCINRANQACANGGGEMEYIKAVAGCRGGGSFRCDVQGARTLSVYLESLAASMREGSADFVEAWHPSRSSRQRARASAAAKAVGAPAAKRKPEGAPRKMKARRGAEAAAGGAF
jgi:hypothetical protein